MATRVETHRPRSVQPAGPLRGDLRDGKDPTNVHKIRPDTTAERRRKPA